ncbi:RNA/RNP complex-1-interacting phosphatase isoform X4 [Poecile atricapillus]|uniref:RNA/RNP complex-1-interacting phosphatase isoform X4 n=1 Tax=Poecile atricapillus TaxID=48891 RepID=UPI0027385DDE|nr:RNA/RNP complex-1-interacting phosphatase isoform X4 [Poecile atricapillus]
MAGRGASRVPERWTDYIPLGCRMPGTRFIAFKVPLKKSFEQNLLPEERFSPHDLIRKVRERQEELGLIIDLTYTTRYYGREELPSTLRYSKILTMGREIPNRRTILRFNYLVKKFLTDNKDNDKLIGVHCTHGLNRTGYLVCRYLIDVEGMEPNAAIELFNKSRGHPMERPNYIQDLQRRALKNSCELKNLGSDLSRKKGSTPGKPQKQQQPPLAVPRSPSSSRKKQQPGPTAQGQPQEQGHRHGALGQAQLEKKKLEKLEQKQLEQKQLEQKQLEQKQLEQKQLEQKKQRRLEKKQRKKLEKRQQRKLEKRQKKLEEHLEQNHLEQGQDHLEQRQQNHLEQGQDHLEQRQQKNLEQKQQRQQSFLEQNCLEQRQQKQQNHLEQRQKSFLEQNHLEQGQKKLEQRKQKKLEQNMEQKQQRQQNHLEQSYLEENCLEQRKQKKLEQKKLEQRQQSFLEQNHLEQSFLELSFPEQRKQKKLEQSFPEQNHLEQRQQEHRQPCTFPPKNFCLSPPLKKQHKELFSPQIPHPWLPQEPSPARKRRRRKHKLRQQEIS